ncbi:MAG: NTP transferase domain-containing protein [Isosphaeraceae bacterium]
MGKINNLAVVILCGGASRRMGFPKALLPVGHESMVERVCRLAGEVSHEIIIVTSPEQTLPQIPGNIRIINDYESFQGPLAAMGRGFPFIDPTTEFAFVTAVDTPLLEPDIIRFLHSQIAETDFDLIMPTDESHFYPLASIYRVKPVHDEIQNLLGQNKFRPVFLMDQLKGIKINLENLRSIDPDLKTFQNINTRSEYRKFMNEMNLELEHSFKSKCVNVEFYGSSRRITGINTCELECDFYHDFVTNLELKYPDLTNRIIFDGRLHRAYRLVRNSSEFIDDFNDSPSDGDTIMLINADAGG